MATSTPKEIEALKGQILLSMAGLKTRFVGFLDQGQVVNPRELHFLTSEFTAADGSKVTKRIPIIIDQVDARGKTRAELTAQELREAGYSSLEDLNARVTMDHAYERKLRDRLRSGPYGLEHPVSEDDKNHYPALNFTYHIATGLDLRRHHIPLESGIKMVEEMRTALREVGMQNSMLGTFSFVKREYDMAPDDVWNRVGANISNLRHQRTGDAGLSTRSA